MRKIFSSYGLFILALFSSVVGINIFINVILNGDSSLFSLVKNWINSLI